LSIEPLKYVLLLLLAEPGRHFLHLPVKVPGSEILTGYIWPGRYTPCHEYK
jgi:hypothetical protein